MNKKVIFVICTMLSKEEFWNKSTTGEFLIDNNLKENTDYFVQYSNSKGLPEVYNKFITNEYKHNIIVFIHDDVILGYNINTIQRELNKAHETYDIVGLAGATKIDLSYPTLWHIMQRGASGSVGHTNGTYYQMTNYGPSPSRCICVDGLFISIHVDRVLQANHRFDEQFTFHHYDIDFCISGDSKHLKVGTWPIYVTHLSPGLRSLDNEKWKKSNYLFCKKYNIQ